MLELETIREESKMCDNVNTTQNAQFGSHDNKFVSQENNYYGPSLTDVYNFAMALLEITSQNYAKKPPKLQRIEQKSSAKPQ